MSVPTSDGQGPIARVREGMQVVDSAGDEIGTVEEVRMGDAGAVTTEGQGSGGGAGIAGAIATAIGGGEALPDSERERLLRLGFVRIDASGLFAGDRYAAADQVADVEGDVVRLSVGKDRLVG